MFTAAPFTISRHVNNLDVPDRWMNKEDVVHKYNGILLNDELIYRWTYLQNRNRPTDTENKLMVTKEENGRGLN